MSHRTIIEISVPEIAEQIVLGLPVVIRTVKACQAAGSSPCLVAKQGAAFFRELLDGHDCTTVEVVKQRGEADLFLSGEASYDPLFVKRLVLEKRTNPQEIEALVPSCWWQKLDGRAFSFHQAQKKLLETIRQNTAGWVAPYLNKPVSFFITRFLVRTPITPNQITIANLLLAFLAAWLLAHPSWGVRVVGASLMQLSSIIDGCDGEVARLKFMFSKIGGWLDTVADDVSNNAFFVGLFVGLTRTSGEMLYTQVGWVAVAMSLGASFVIYQQLLAIAKSANARDFKPAWDRQEKSWFEWVRPIAKRDFFIFVIFLAQILNLRVSLFWLMTLVTGITFVLYLASLVIGLRKGAENKIP